MYTDQFETFKQALVAAVEEHLAAGGTLATGTFGKGTCLCPLSCLLGKEWQTAADRSGKGLEQVFYNKMGFSISNDEMWSFIGGYDHTGFDTDKSQTMRDLGQEIRKKYYFSTANIPSMEKE